MNPGQTTRDPFRITPGPSLIPVDENRRRLEAPLIRQAIVEQQTPVLPEPSFNSNYRSIRGTADMSFMLLLHNYCMSPLEDVMPSLNPSCFTQQRQKIKEIIAHEKVLHNQTRPERLTEFSLFEQGLIQKTAARKLSSNYLFHGLSLKDLLVFIFYHYKLLGSKIFDLVDFFYKTNV